MFYIVLRYADVLQIRQGVTGVVLADIPYPMWPLEEVFHALEERESKCAPLSPENRSKIEKILTGPRWKWREAHVACVLDWWSVVEKGRPPHREASMLGAGVKRGSSLHSWGKWGAMISAPFSIPSLRATVTSVEFLLTTQEDTEEIKDVGGCTIRFSDGKSIFVHSYFGATAYRELPSLLSQGRLEKHYQRLADGTTHTSYRLVIDADEKSKGKYIEVYDPEWFDNDLSKPSPLRVLARYGGSRSLIPVVPGQPR